MVAVVVAKTAFFFYVFKNKKIVDNNYKYSKIMIDRNRFR